MTVLTGREAYRVTSLSDDAIIKEMMTVLRKLYGNNIPEPASVLKGPWVHDPLFYGSYCNKPLGFSDEVNKDLICPTG